MRSALAKELHDPTLIVGLQNPLQTTLNHLETWSSNLGIEFSPETTEMLIFAVACEVHEEKKMKIKRQKIGAFPRNASRTPDERRYQHAQHRYRVHKA